MSANGYMVLMLKHLATRGSLFLFVRTHQQLQYYFHLDDSRQAANQKGMQGAGGYPETANVVELHPAARSRATRRR